MTVPSRPSRLARRWSQAGFALLLTLALLLPGQALALPPAGSAGQPLAVPGEALITLHEAGDGLPADLQPLLDRFGVTEVTGMAGPPVYRLRGGNGASTAEMVAAFSASPLVAAAEPNLIVSVARQPMPDDPLYQGGNQWHLDMIGIEEAWAITTGSPEVLVAVVDSGIKADHPDLAGKVVGGYDFVNERAEVVDDNGHGTMVASFITANTNNHQGLAGLAPETRLLAFKALDASGGGSHFDVARAIVAAANAGARVINLSLGGLVSTRITQIAADYAHARGAVVVAASGNDGTYQPNFPAAGRGAIAVGATDRQDEVALFSQRGAHVAVVAPGSGVLGANRAGEQTVASGTSFSAPIVSGVVALMLAVNPSLTAADVQLILEGTAEDLGPAGFDLAAGWGRVHAGRAVVAARDNTRQPNHGGVIQGRVTGADPARVLITVEPLGEITRPDADGAYQLPYRGRTTYVLRATAPGLGMAGPVVLESTGQPGEVFTADFTFEP